MKQKRTFITLLLVIALLCLGIAYAAVTSQTLTISGSAGVLTDEQKVNVIFTAAEVQGEAGTDYPGTVTANVDNSDKTKATINVSDFKTIGDSVTVIYTIENQQTDLQATLAAPVVTLTGAGKQAGTPSGWFDVDCTLSGNTLAKNGEAGDSQTATVVVTLNQTPVTADQVTAASDTITIDIVASPVTTTLN